MNVEQLRKVMKPTVKKSKSVYLISYLENEDSTTITYAIKGQKESHLKISIDIWNGMQFKKAEGKILITDLNGLVIKTNENGWSRLVTESEEEEETDE